MVKEALCDPEFVVQFVLAQKGSFYAQMCDFKGCFSSYGEQCHYFSSTIISIYGVM